MSRRVRLRRTVAGVLALGLVTVGVVAFTRPGDDLQGVAAQTSLPVDTQQSTATSTSAPSATTKPPKDTVRQAARAAVPQHASGRLRSVRVPGKNGTGAGRRVTYSVEIEQGLGVDARAVARTVHSVLTDRRGWQRQDHVRFVHVSPRRQADGARVDIRITVASPALTNKLCAPLRTMSKLDCFNESRAVLNYRNWHNGIRAYRGDLAAYRAYLINHEVGHGLGHGHVHCQKKGAPAQVMIQQTISLEGCTPWPWPSRPKP